MFLQNKYSRWYYKIINNAVLENRNKTQGYYEKHHIIPKSLSGSDDKDNLVLLTAREHYICHKLLTKFTENQYKKKMFLALWAFNRLSKTQQRHRITSRDYEYTRKNLSSILSKSRKGKHLKGTTLTSEHKKKISNSLKGKVVSDETKQKMKDSWKLRPERSKEHCEAISRSKKGIKHSDNTKQKMSESKKGKNPIHTQIKWTCEHCGKVGVGISNYNRWHGNNCKRKHNG